MAMLVALVVAAFLFSFWRQVLMLVALVLLALMILGVHAAISSGFSAPADSARATSSSFVTSQNR